MAGQKLRGFAGQSMSGRRRFGTRAVAYPVLAAGSGTITSPAYPTTCEMWVIGGGAAINSATTGPGAAGAAYKRFYCPKSTPFPYVVGAGAVGAADGNPSSVSLAALGRPSVIGGAGLTTTAGPTPGVGGVGSGGDINRRGGSGGAVASSGGTGEFGGAGGPGDGTHGGSGGAAGFSDFGSPLGGAGSALGAAGSAGSGGQNGVGGDGLVLIVFTRTLG